MGKRATIAVRVNPDVEAGGHAKISTGKAENKFGVSMAEAERLYGNASNIWLASVRSASLAISAVRSPILPPLRPHSARCGVSSSVCVADGPHCRQSGSRRGLAPLLQGPPPPAPADYAAMIARVMAGLADIQFAFEPGRMIAANPWAPLAQVLLHQLQTRGPQVPGLGCGHERPAATRHVRRPSRHPACRAAGWRSRWSRRRRSHLRDRRHLYQQPRPTAARGWRPRGLHDRRGAYGAAMSGAATSVLSRSSPQPRRAGRCPKLCAPKRAFRKSADKQWS